LSDAKFVLKAEGISKQFGGVWVLKNVDFNLKPGEVHALVGENGAGKSTLIKVISGVYSPDRGKVIVADKEVKSFNVKQMESHGIFTVHQEINLVPFISAMENVFIGSEPVRGKFPKILDYSYMKQKAQSLVQTIGVELNLKAPAYTLSASEQQIIQICRGLVANARVMILDEPTSSLSAEEISSLFSMVKKLRKEGVGIIFVSHKLDEVLQISDRITVLKDGEKIGTIPRQNATEEKIVSMMVGKSGFKAVRFHVSKKVSETILQLKNITTNKLRGVNLELRKGEVLGIVGVVGAGKTELAEVLFGLDHPKSGEIYLEGEKIAIKSPTDAIKKGFALVPENRRIQGIFARLSLSNNITAAYLSQWCKGGVIFPSLENEVTRSFIQKLAIRTRGPSQLLQYLSGGNQQKAVLAKWLGGNFKILMADEATQGVDVKTKEDIYSLVREIASEGRAVMFFSSYVPEIVKVSDRIVAMREGTIAAEFYPDEENLEHKIMMAILTEKGGNVYDSKES